MALVVTIVVLLILAGVTLNLVLGENGIISKAKEARDKMAQAQHNEEIEMEKLYNELISTIDNFTGGSNEEEKPTTPPEPEEPELPKAEVGEKAEDNLTIDGKSPTASNPIIPKDFIPINTDDAKWDAKGGPEYNNGLVITDSITDGNEFVWVPVSDVSTMYTAGEKHY